MKNEMMPVNTKVGDEYIILAENIRTVREAMHLSRSQFANHCHVSKETIESIEHLAKTTSLSTLVRIAHACGIDVGTLLTKQPLLRIVARVSNSISYD